MNQRIALQCDELLGKASSAPLSELLPSVLLLAQKVSNSALEQWARLEMEGYWDSNPALTEDVVVPEYRSVGGQYYDHYGRLFIVKDPGLAFIQEYRLRQPVAELERLAESHSPTLTICDPTINQMIRDHLKVEVANFSFSPLSITGVLSAIRSKLLFWLQDFHSSFENHQQKQNSTSDTPVASLTLEGLHPLIVEVAGKLYRDGHYRQAILDAYILLVEQVKKKSGCTDLDGTPLMQAIFSAKNPVIRVSDNQEEQIGFMWLFSGAVMGIRNPKAHRLIVQTDPQRTLEWLAFASVLLRVLDDCGWVVGKEWTSETFNS